MLFPFSALCSPCHILTQLLPSHFLDLHFTSLNSTSLLLGACCSPDTVMTAFTDFLIQSLQQTLSLLPHRGFPPIIGWPVEAGLRCRLCAPSPCPHSPSPFHLPAPSYLPTPSTSLSFTSLTLTSLVPIPPCTPTKKQQSTKGINILISQSVSSATQSYPTLCDPMNRSTPGLPVHYQLPEFTQTHVHRVGDAIQPSHPLSSPSLPAPNLSQHQGLFQWVNSSPLWQKVKMN